jgi:hypothetical protein
MKTHYLFFTLMLVTVQVAYSQNYVQNGNFAETTTDELTGLTLPVGWNLDGSAFLSDGTKILNLVTSWLPDGATDGTRALDLWRGTDEPYQLKLTQTISELPDGIYSLSAMAALGGENVFSLYAKIAENERTTPMPESGDYEKKEMNSIQITDGVAIIGFTANSTSSANWFDITNFELVRTGDLTSINNMPLRKLSVFTNDQSVRIASDELILSVGLISMDGKKLYSSKPVGKEITFSVPQSGVYILQICQTSGTQVKKIVI